MNKEKMIEEVVKQVMMSMKDDSDKKVSKECENKSLGAKIDAKRDYPLAKKRPELIKTPTNKKLEDITLENVLNGEIKSTDVRISPETLELQAEVAEGVNRDAFAKNLRRASELIAISDERILEIYNALRPNRSTKQELLDIADELEEKYNATINSNFVKEAAEVYEKRNMLRRD
jgi:propanediol dehydratase small subunit